jgi:uncharacterized protein involved in outer membrane biogenesis
MMRLEIRRWMPRLRVAAIAAIAAVLVFGIVGYLAIPMIARWGVETVATRELGRTVRVQEITANPFYLRVTLHGLEVAGAAGETAPLLTVREVIANASAASILRRAPVLDDLGIDGLTANVVRLEAQRFNFSDIVERIQAQPKTSEEPARFSVSNIEVTNSVVNFDDRPTGKKHTLTELRVGIPFISSLPTHTDITVQPAFAARLNGTPIDVKGETRPFHETLESSIDLKLDGLDIPTYLTYSPVPLNFVVPSGTLTTDLRIAFRRAAPAKGEQPARPARTLVSGTIGVAGMALAAPAARPEPLASWKLLRVVLDDVEPLARRAVIGDVTLSSPVFEVARDTAGAVNWLRLVQAPVLDSATPDKTALADPTSVAAATPPFAVTLKHASLSGGTVNYTDDSAGRFLLQVVNLNVEASGLTTASDARGKLRASGDIANGGGSTTLEGEVGLAPVTGRFTVAARDVKMRAPARYLANVVNASIDGSSDADAVLEFALTPEKSIVLKDLAWKGKDLKVRGPAGSNANFDLAALTMDGAELDLLQQRLTIGKIALDGPRATVSRLADGQINWLTAFRARPAGAAPDAPPAAAASSDGWKILVKEATIARGDLRLEDLAVEPHVKLRASAITGTVRNLTGDGKERADVDLRTRFGSGGTVAVNGGARWNPLASEARIDARNLDVAALRPYLAARLNAVLARAEVSGRGRVIASQVSPDAPLALNYAGNARVGNLHLLDASGENDLLKWQVLDLDQVIVRLGQEPPNVSVGKVALSDFYARVIVSGQGRLNLVDVIKRGDYSAAPSEAAKPLGERVAPKSDAGMPVDREMLGNEVPASRDAGKTATTVLAAPVADPATPRPVIRIGHIDFTRGNVNFTDNFIKPNYTANMTGLGGTVTTLASDGAEPATLTLAGKIDDDAPLEIDGRLNPLAPILFLEIEGRTRGVDLPRLTPYSVKYAGYPIVKGKLSMEVKYKVEDGRLAANNHLFLDQLTFGEKVESPTATKLPVLLAVSLLKNSRGEIDLNLPISGTLSDPKFSVGSVIVQVIVNLLTKVVTAPFTLLAAAFGGGEELGYVEFAPGAAVLQQEQTKRVDTLAKALSERPGLKLDVIGRVDPGLDTDGVRRAKYDSKLRAAKVRQRVRASGEAIDPATVTINAEERPALIAAVYGDEDIPNKPRNLIGIAKSIPAPEMEALILDNLAVTPEDLRALANQRAAVVRDRLEAEGKVTRERMFVVEPKLTAAGIQDKGATTRVDFSLK